MLESGQPSRTDIACAAPASYVSHDICPRDIAPPPTIMPELPEVETVRRGLAPALQGATIESVTLNRGDLRFPFAPGFAEALTGTRVESLSRRAKYLLLELSNGRAVIAHLGMTGSFRVEDGEGHTTPGVFTHERSKDTAHDHVVMCVRGERGAARITYNDPRRFGFMLLTDRATLSEHPSLAALGIEPTGNELSAATLAERLAGKRTPLKAALMDQGVVAGLGNIYVCEALWRSGLSPKRIAATLVRKDGKPTQRVERLATAIREVIAEAIEAGGSSLRDYVHADGSLGYFQNAHAVYDREHEACRRDGCRGTVRRTVQSGRSTFHCTECQR